MSFCGLDPGVTGAMAVLSATGSILHLIKIPTYKVKGSNEIDIRGLQLEFNNLKVVYPDLKICVERIWGTSNKSPSSICSLCETSGIIKASIIALGLEPIYVTAQKWKAKFLQGYNSSEKDSSVEAALSYFKGASDYIIGPRGGKNHNMADALFIAEWGRIT